MSDRIRTLMEQFSISAEQEREFTTVMTAMFTEIDNALTQKSMEALKWRKSVGAAGSDLVELTIGDILVFLGTTNMNMSGRFRGPRDYNEKAWDLFHNLGAEKKKDLFMALLPDVIESSPYNAVPVNGTMEVCSIKTDGELEPE